MQPSFRFSDAATTAVQASVPGSKMRILYIDIDSQRLDHLGCYGYHRNTSPNIDRIAAAGVRFEQCHASDVICMPSRTSLFSGRFGIHTGVINHGGVAAEPFVEGPTRDFRANLGQTSWMHCLREVGLKTITISPFGERHSAWWFYANFSETYNTGKLGRERADEIAPVAIDWLRRNGKADNWFLHVNFWDPHAPFRTPQEFGDPFAHQPVPAWLTEEVRQMHWHGCGPLSPQDMDLFIAQFQSAYPRQPERIESAHDVRRMFDGYDTAVRYVDDHIGRILNVLADLGVLEETAVVISADHGECLGELGVYGGHWLADEITTRIPLIIRWPGITSPATSRIDNGLHYHVDFAATILELVGGGVPDNWDAVSFAEAFKEGRQVGRDYLVVSLAATACQRSVRFDDYICIRSYHDGLYGLPDVMLFNVKQDPHEQHDLASRRPDLVAKAMAMLDEWHGQMMKGATHPHDPMWTVLTEGGPFHIRHLLSEYLQRLRQTGRGSWADRLAGAHCSGR